MPTLYLTTNHPNTCAWVWAGYICIKGHSVILRYSDSLDDLQQWASSVRLPTVECDASAPWGEVVPIFSES